MKSMFYNYDHNVAPDEEPVSCPAEEGLYGSTIATPLLNAKNEVIGVKAKQNSKFTLYFKIFSADCTEIPGPDFERATFNFEIIDFKHEVVCTIVPELLTDYMNEIAVEIATSDKGPLSYGVYRMNLSMMLDDQKYTLFSDRDGILSIE